MTKKIKLLFTLVCTFLATLVISFAAMLSGENTKVVAFAAGDEANISVDGVSVRVPEKDEAETYYGIRFKAVISNPVADAIYGVEIKPADLADSEAVNTNPEGKTIGLRQEGDSYYFYGSIVNLKKENLTRPFTARAYYKVGEAAAVYSAWSEARAIYSVATQALADEASELSVENEAALEANVVNVVMNTENAGYYAVETVEVKAPEGKTLDALAAGDVVTVSATAKNNVNGKTLKVYPKVNAVNIDGSGKAVNGVLKQVAGTQDQYTVSFDTQKAYKINATLGNDKSATNAVEANTTLIGDKDTLLSFLATASNNNAILTADIANGTSVIDVPRNASEFTGVFDGNGHEIAKLYTNGATGTAGGGIFRILGNGAVIKNAIFSDAIIHGDQAGLFAARVAGSAKIENVAMSVKLETPDNFCGAMFGQLPAGTDTITVKDCIVEVTHDAFNQAKHGAIIGRHTAGTVVIDNSYVIGEGDLVSSYANSNDYADPTNAKKLPVKDLGAIYYVESDTNVSIELSKMEGTVSKVLLDGKEIAYTVDSENLVLGLVSGDLVVITENKAYSATIAKADTIISTAAELKAFVEYPVSGTAVLAGSIDMKNVTIAVATTDVFTGTFDGCGYAITNIYLTGNRGLFGGLNNATVKNVSLQGTVAGNQGALLAAVAQGAISIENVVVDAALESSVVEHFQGGLIGVNWGTTTVKDSLVYATSLVDGVDSALLASQGIAVGRLMSANVSFSNSYLVAIGGSAASNFTANSCDTVNTAAASSTYTVAAFNAAIAANTVTLTSWQTAQWAVISPAQSASL